jgi:hypothetical protein
MRVVPLANITDCRVATARHATGRALHLAQHAVEQGRLAAPHLANDPHKLAGPHFHIEVVHSERASSLDVVFRFHIFNEQQVLRLGRNTLGA